MNKNTNFLSKFINNKSSSVFKNSGLFSKFKFSIYTNCNNKTFNNSSLNNSQLFKNTLSLSNKQQTFKNNSNSNLVGKFNFCNKVDKNENSSNTNNNTTIPPVTPKKESFFQRLKKDMKQYGVKALIVYAIFYGLGIGFFYFLVKEKYIDSKF